LQRHVTTLGYDKLLGLVRHPLAPFMSASHINQVVRHIRKQLLSCDHRLTLWSLHTCNLHVLSY